jgi:nucleotide-binding universal stress UspA family protein
LGASKSKGLRAFMKTILAAIDFSPVSRAVLDTATELARVNQGRIVLLNVVQPPAVVSDLGMLAGDVLQFTAEVERGSRRHLQQIAKRLTSKRYELERVCVQGIPRLEILAQARKRGADYIVMGTHGHTAFHNVIAGSTASGVLKRASCPVVLVPPVRRQATPRPPRS